MGCGEVSQARVGVGGGRVRRGVSGGGEGGEGVGLGEDIFGEGREMGWEEDRQNGKDGWGRREEGSFVVVWVGVRLELHLVGTFWGANIDLILSS